MRYAAFVCLLTSLCVIIPGFGSAVVSKDTIVLQNQHVHRTLELADGVWRTVSIARADRTDQVAVNSDEFAVRLMDGTELTAADYQAVGEPQVRESGGETSVRIYCVARPGAATGAPRSLTITYLLGDEPYLRKTITLAMSQGDAIDTLCVERFRTDLPCDRGGRGEPVFIGDAWFAGLEYPGSQTGCADGLVSLDHFPGLAHKQQGADGQWVIESKVAVIGTGAKGDPLELAFSDYVDTIRIPTRNFMQYNSWYDWRGDQLTVENLMGTYEGFKSGLLDPYGLKMDAFVPDDGWQNQESIWVPRENLYPTGFAPLRDALEGRGTRMGIWMPLNGTNLNADWGAGQGYEKSNRGGFYCLVGPKYNAAIREATKRVITQGNLSYYKHDFNHLRCTAEGHGHLPDDRHGHEANLDAELELLEYERDIQPGIFLNVTSSVWLSPWWLMHADSIWMCASDFGYNKAYPQLSPREWAMSYRDAHFRNVYSNQRKLVPVSAMMTHGIIHGKRCKLGGNEETLREWSDYVVMYYGRGVQLKELYVSPEMLDENWWKVLGEATRWAVDNTNVLEKVVMVGGDPQQGEVYGYAHWLGDKGIICLRNPAPFEQTINVPFDKSVKYRGAPGKSFRGRAIYPYVEPLTTRLVSGDDASFTLPGCSVMAYELEPGVAPAAAKAAPLPAIKTRGSAEIDETGAAKLTGSIAVPDEDMQRCELHLLVRGAGKGLDPDSVTLDGRKPASRQASGDGWTLQSIDLMPMRGKTITLAATIPGGGDVAFSSPNISLIAYVIADRPVPAVAASDEHLPYPIAQSFRRQTTTVIPDTKLERRRGRGALTADELKQAKAAKLRIRVFDANGDGQYRDKFIILNGEKLALIPANKGTLSAWQESIIELRPEQLGLLKLSNEITLTNAGGDCYKFTGLTLAVQLADGKWVESTSDWTVQSSVGSWLYTEGAVFRGDVSRPVTLAFD